MPSKPKTGQQPTAKKAAVSVSKAGSTSPAKKTAAKKSVEKKVPVKKAASSASTSTAKKTASPKRSVTTTKTSVAKTTAPRKKVATEKKSEAVSSAAKKAAPSKASKKTEETKTAVTPVPVASAAKTEVKAKVTTSVKEKPAVSSAAAPAKKKPAVTGSQTQISIMGIAPYDPKPGEEYMNDLQKEHFTQILNAWKHALMEEVDGTVTHMRDEAANFPDPNDRASQEEEFSLELRTRDRERKLIKKIEEAIKSIEDDEYGYCEACGVDIGIRRLEARPTATLCIDCKTLDEIKEKQLIG